MIGGSNQEMANSNQVENISKYLIYLVGIELPEKNIEVL